MDRRLAPDPPWRRHRSILVALFLVTGVAVASLARLHGNTYRVAMDQLTIGTVSRTSFEDFIAVRATAVPLLTHYLTAEQGGAVEQVLAEDGARVHAGQPLVVLGNAALQLQVASREADAASQINALENTRLQLEDARFKYEHDLLDIEHQLSTLKSNLARDKILLDGNAIAPATYQQEAEEYAYEQQLRTATIASRDTQQAVRTRGLAELHDTLKRLNDSVATAKASLKALTVRAAADGQLTALNAEIGQSKEQGAVLGQVDSLDQFKLSAEVDEFHLGRVALGQTASFTFNEHSYSARVAKIYPQIANGIFRVDLHFDDPTPQGIHTGQAIDIRLRLGEAAPSTTLPNGPFYQDTGGRWVFVVSPDGKYATRREVRLGRRNPERVEVTAGLRPGDRVIVSGYEALQKFDRIEIQPSAPNP